MLLDENELLSVPDRIDPAEAETFVVGGVTARQMLHRVAHIRPGQTILLHGTNGSVGTTLAQLAQHAGVRVIDTAAPRHHDERRARSVEPIDYNDTYVARSVRDIAPGGVDAVFDHVGGKSVFTSYRLPNERGTLVCYAIASSLENCGSMLQQFLSLMPQLAWWNVLPNGHKAVFYNIWSGFPKRDTKSRRAFRARLRQDFATLMDLLAREVIVPQIAARFPWQDVIAAVQLAESRTVYGNVVLIPEACAIHTSRS